MSGAPSYTFRPTYFKPSAVPCDIFVTDETKSRRITGGTFFRSRGTGKAMNFIYIQGDIVIDGFLGQQYVLTITQRDTQGNHPIIATETFKVVYQNATPPVTVSPPGPPQTPTINVPSPSILALRKLINQKSRIIEMPEASQDYLYRGHLDSNILSKIPQINLIGGNGAPLPPDPEFFSIRTGPERVLSFIVHRDLGVTLAEVDIMQEWNGKAWQVYSPIVG